MQQFHLPFRREKPFIPIRINVSNIFPSLTIPGYNSYYDINAIIFSPSTLLPFIIQIQYTRIIGRLNFVNRSSSIRNVIITLFVRTRQRAVVEILFSKVKKRLYLGRGWGGEGGCKNTRCLLSFNARDETGGGKTVEVKGMFEKRAQCSRIFCEYSDLRIISQSGEEMVKRWIYEELVVVNDIFCTSYVWKLSSMKIDKSRTW